MSYEDYTQKAHAPLKKNCCVLPITVQKSPSSSGIVTATWYLRVAALARFFRGKLDNAATGNAQN